MWANNLSRISNDAGFVTLARGLTVAFRFERDHSVDDGSHNDDSASVTVNVVEGTVLAGRPDEVDFALRADGATWARLASRNPEAGWQSILACVLRGDVRLVGSERQFQRHLQLVRRAHEILRGMDSELSIPPPAPTLQGSYVRILHSSYGACDVYVERTGAGVPVLCFPTAGSDSSQYHGLSQFLPDGVELIAVDLPWHGKSQVPWGKTGADYSLTESEYLETIESISDALSLEHPVLFGASMAGAAVVRAGLRYPARFRGVIAAQAGVQVTKRLASWFGAADVNQNIAAAEWTFGLMAPKSPKSWRDRVWWGYTRGGYRSYTTDIEHYVEWDLTDEIESLGELPTKVVLLGGEYDTTVPAHDVADLASRIPGAEFISMPDLGHFPHAENPERFSAYFRDALSRIDANLFQTIGQ
ncbi:MAG: alpha/beta fold hydrolase [Gulosibacter sp.]|uniref:alpha/beta fold hydrolase n=1 Tax=Gulosibacter sp. TaxID=2817531 RepID=UPI003F90D297